MEALIGVVLGALISFIGAFLNYWLLFRQERRKEGKKAIADVASALGAMYAMMESLSWEAGACQQQLSEQRLDDYGRRLETHLEHLFGSLPVVAVHDAAACDTLRTIAEEAKAIDEEINKAVDEPNASRRKQLCVECQKKLQIFYNKLKTVVETALKRIKGI